MSRDQYIGKPFKPQPLEEPKGALDYVADALWCVVAVLIVALIAVSL